MLLYLLACLQEFPSEIAKTYHENPDADYDLDGFTERDGDCNDRNPDIHPNAEEICDGVDNNCDETIDTDALDVQIWYADADEDGFGVENDSVVACINTKPEGYIEQKERDGRPAFDCNDQDPTVHPDAQEICDEIDNNCSGEVDDYTGFNAPRWYLDGDGDGFGDPSQYTQACVSPPGFVADFTDCDDSNNLIHVYVEGVEGGIELCDEEGNDENCNGIINEDSAADAPLWYADADLDGFGSLFVITPSCTQPSGFIESSGDCNDSNASIHPEAQESCNNIDDNCDGNIDEGSNASAPNLSLLFYADTDGDGFGDPSITKIQCSLPNGFVENSDDCDDSNAELNQSDVDADGFSTCAGDCNDNDPTLNLNDVDADGYTTCDGDCSDTNNTRHPGAAELCSTPTDDDCDGLINEGVGTDAPSDASTWYADIDEDGFGAQNNTLIQCEEPTGYKSEGTDCDDADSTIYPGADETCNSIDDDCDGDTDEDDAIDKNTWYADTDGDGFGDGGAVTYACDAPSGTVAILGDCNDNDSSINPDAIEVCEGTAGIDNDCDGLIDDADTDVDLSTGTVYYSDNDADGFGDLLFAVYACLQPPGTSTNADDCDDTNILRAPGRSEFCNNLDDDCDGTIDNAPLDATTYHIDKDGDGHGVPGSDLVSCPTYDSQTGNAEVPSGYSESSDDCDDSDSDDDGDGIIDGTVRSPSNDELCTNDIDENCDEHMTAGATDVSAFLVDSDNDGYGSGLKDSQGNLAYKLESCIQPYGYIEYDPADKLDCNDNDDDVYPYELDYTDPNWVDEELCNGKVDRCENDVYGDLTPPDNERDDDGDGFVECSLDVDPLQWADPNTHIALGDVLGGDCEDSDDLAYPGATEICNGAFEDCSDPKYGTQDSPDLETDNDEDCFVECSGFDANSWEGPSITCEHLDENGSLVQESEVIGGEDCADGNASAYIGGAYLTPTVCAQDLDGDGYGDCNLTGVHPDYFCDFGYLLQGGGIGPDFVFIEAGVSPLGDYELTNDYYIMTTELTVGMYESLHGNPDSSLGPRTNFNHSSAFSFANHMSSLYGLPECYNNGVLNANYSTLYDCPGFRLPTPAEYDYAARSGTEYDFWTPNGGGSALPLGDISTSTHIDDGSSNPPLLSEYTSACLPNGSGQVAAHKPNGFGLYDTVGGGHWELVSNFEDSRYNSHCTYHYTNPYCGANSTPPSNSQFSFKGWRSLPYGSGWCKSTTIGNYTLSRGGNTNYSYYANHGVIRLVITAN